MGMAHAELKDNNDGTITDTLQTASPETAFTTFGWYEAESKNFI